jgi:hypothetical protein
MARSGCTVPTPDPIKRPVDQSPRGICFAFVTAFIAGFGDVAPRSGGARVVTVLLVVLGVLIVGVAVAVAVHALGIVLAARGGWHVHTSWSFDAFAGGVADDNPL